MSKIAKLLRKEKKKLMWFLIYSVSTRFCDENFIKLNKGEFFIYSCYINSLSTLRFVA